MAGYVPSTDADRQQMLETVGVGSIHELFAEIPASTRDPKLHLPPPLSELELTLEITALADRNLNLTDHPCFLGAGAYHHYIPSLVSYVVSRSELYTSYTPYQPEVSQGTLQTMFEYQSLIAGLTGMDVANASMYDGATAVAEAAMMAVRLTERTHVSVASTIDPEYLDVLRTYASAHSIGVSVVDLGQPLPLESDACLIVQQPDFFGRLAILNPLAEAAHHAGALFVACVNPISLGLIKPPREYGADIVVGEGQPLGNPLSYGGPYLGLFACRSEYVRQMPGRVVGASTDARGQTGYVLTLQTREQHIRREKATSNICTNEALNALAAAAYLAVMGPKGLRRVAELCYQKAHYAAAEIAKLDGFNLVFADPFFHEFVVRCPISPSEINRRLLEEKIIGGLDISPQIKNGWLICVTELISRHDIDRLVDILGSM